MAKGQRTGKQKALLVISIIFIVFGALGLLVLAGIGAGLGVLASYSAMSGGVSAGDALFAGSLGAAILGFMSIGCLIDLIIGILGVRGANDASKVGAFNVFAIIGLVVAIITFVLTVFAVVTASSANTDASSNIISAVIGLILPAVCVWLGTSIKKEGNPTQL